MHEVFGAVLAGQALRRDRAESTPGYGSPALRGGGTAACGQDYRLSRADERSAQALWQGRPASRSTCTPVLQPHGAPAHLHCSLTEHLHCTSIATTPAHICKVGFIKPVGQQHVNVEHNGAMVRVDKDVQLIKECVEMPRHTQPHTHLVLRGGRAERSAHTLAPART